MEERLSPPWSRVTKVTVILTGLAILGVLIYSFRDALPPLVIAALIAYILTPVVNLVCARLRLPRGLATLLVYLLFLALLGLAIGLLAPPLVRQVTALRLNLEAATDLLESFFTRQYAIGGFVIDPSSLYLELQQELAAMVRPAVTQTLALAMQAVTTVVWTIFIFVISFYLIKDGPQLSAQVEKWVPPDLRHDYRRLQEEINSIWRDFFRGQLLVGLAMGGSILVLMGAIGLPNVLILALLAVVLEFLPSLGHTIWLIIAIPIALLRGSLWLPLPNFWFAILVLAIHMVLQQVDLNFYIPRFVGRRVHLHPLVVIVGIILGGILAGVLGIFLAAPIISSLRVLVKYTYCKLLDLYPWPPQEEGQPAMEISTPGWLQAVWARVEEKIRDESGPDEEVEG
ncbi:MAG TPA: AI-2E family transporter [Thermoflexia bacterium]|jgi:predicted PurR-regulated permease PerM|nr:AI-2E family transporter [Thermoflexia bacterium]